MRFDLNIYLLNKLMEVGKATKLPSNMVTNISDIAQLMKGVINPGDLTLDLGYDSKSGDWSVTFKNMNGEGLIKCAYKEKDNLINTESGTATLEFHSAVDIFHVTYTPTLTTISYLCPSGNYIIKSDSFAEPVRLNYYDAEAVENMKAITKNPEYENASYETVGILPDVSEVLDLSKGSRSNYQALNEFITDPSKIEELVDQPKL